MRREFASELHKHMEKNNSIVVLTGDLGYGMFDKIRTDFPERFFNTGAAEQAMMGIACGLAIEGKIPVVYSITPFLLYRPFETLRTYVNHEQIPVKLIGSGRDKDYAHDGFSHYAGDDKRFLRELTKIQAYWPEHKEDIGELLENTLYNGKPVYINLSR